MYDRELDPVTEQAPAMSVRALPVALLLCLALPAEARDARMAGEGAGTACTADYATSSTPDADPVRSGRRPAADKPATSRGADADASRPPRWHSFLPGMFR